MVEDDLYDGRSHTSNCSIAAESLGSIQKSETRKAFRSVMATAVVPVFAKSDDDVSFAGHGYPHVQR
jgi:hypothetical protein